jgi:hypothetical protein
MKRILLTTALSVALTGVAAFAQQAQPTLPDAGQNANAPYHHHHHAPDPQRQAERVSKQLNLSPDQTARLAPIFADRDQKFQALMQDQSLTPQQRHEQMRAIHQGTEQQLASVLTPDQLQQLKSMHRNHHRFNGPNSPNGGDQQPPAPPSGL